MAEDTQSASSGETEIEIVRETGKDAEWLNRFCQNVKTHEILYYCEVGTGSKLTIHRGDKTGPIIAKANACLVTPGATDIHLLDPLYTVELEHILYPNSTSRTNFTANRKEYHWKGHSELLEDETKLKIAHFYPSWLVSDVKEHKLGKLVIYEKDILDLVVITALVVQERSDEGRQAIEMARIRSMEMGIGD